MPPFIEWGLIGVCSDKPYERHVVVLKSVDVNVSIRGFVAKITACSTYHNATDKPLEVEYRMPIDEGAAVYKFEAVVNEHKITAQCMEKKKAENVYKDAVESGHTAVIAREDRLTSDILHLALGNLPPSGKAVLQLSMISELKVKTDGAVSFVLPTILHPRYCPADITTDQHTASVVRMEGRGAITVSEAYNIDIIAKVSGGPSIARIISHTDALNVTISDDTKSAEISQDGGFKPDHDWGMLVYYSNPYKANIIRETGDHTCTGLMKDDLIMINLHPEIPPQSYSHRNEIIFIVDCSGSMGGEKIQSARATLLLFLKALPQNVYFNIISFGSSYSVLFPEGSEIFTENTLQKALSLQERLDANMGGTEILQPLKHIYGQPLKQGHARQLILLSDGEVFNVDQVMQLVSRYSHETRVFAVGIGHGASTALISGLARAGHGRSEMVYQQDKLQLKVMGLVKSMLQESVQNVNVSFDVDPPCGVKLIPKAPPVIFGGQHLILYTRVPPATVVKGINLKGVIGDNTLNSEIPGSDIITVHDEDMTLHRLAARSQIKQWQIDEEEDVAEDMISLSLASGVVSRLTALVGVDQDNAAVVAVPKPSATRTVIGCLQMGYACSPGPVPPPLVAQANYSKAYACSPGPVPPPLAAQANYSKKSKAFAARLSREAPLPSVAVPLSSPVPDVDAELCSAPLIEAEATKEAYDEFYMNLDTKEGENNLNQMARQRDRAEMDVHQSLMVIESADDGFMSVVKLQKFDGSWTLEDAAKLTSISLEQLKTADTSKNELAWATAVVLALLKKKFSDQEELWMLLSYKACDFISQCNENPEALVDTALYLFRND